MSIRRRATTNAPERAPVGAREQHRRYVGAERLRSPGIDHQRMAACRLWRLRDAAGEDGADNAGERNHRQHGDETARRESDRAEGNTGAAAIGAESTDRFSPAERCPAYRVPEDIAVAVREKQRRDEIESVELINRGIPTAPVATARDGGMNPTFLAAVRS